MANEPTAEQRAARHSDMSGVRVTLPNGKVLETDDDGVPTGFVEPDELNSGTKTEGA